MNEIEQYYICKVCGNGYDNADTLEFHFKKEHTKLDFIAYLKREAVRQATSVTDGISKENES